jgi:hypothetical protein
MNRTLVCVICQTRSWELTWSGFKRNVLDVLQADLALCIGVPDNYNYQNPFWQHAKYKITFPEYEDWGDAFDYIQDVELNFIETNKPNWRKLLDLNGENWLGGIKDSHRQQPGSGAIIFTARWYLLKFIENEDIFSKYDRIIITRSDFIHNIIHPYVTLMDPKYIWIPDGEGYGGMTDRHVILSKYNYKQYLNLVSNIVTNPLDYFDKMIHYNWNCEKFLKFNILNQQRAIKCYPYHMYTVRQINDHTTWAKGSYHSEHGHFIKYDKEYTAATSLQNMIKNQQDWKSIIHESNPFNCFNCLIYTENDETIGFNETVDCYQVSDSSTLPNHILMLDGKNGEGELFLSNRHLGLFERFSLQKVKITKIGDESFTMNTIDTGEYLFIYNNILGKSYEPQGSAIFKLRNRYCKGIYS